MILYIDATDFNSVTYALKSGNKVTKKSYKIDPRKSHNVLAILGKFLNKSKISSIIVNKGPGSYTGTRVGVTHALALGFAWNVPVKALAKEKFLINLKAPKK